MKNLVRTFDDFTIRKIRIDNEDITDKLWNRIRQRLDIGVLRTELQGALIND